MLTLAIMLIFTNGGSSGRLMPPTAVEFASMGACQAAAEVVRSQVTDANMVVFCVARE